MNHLNTVIARLKCDQNGSITVMFALMFTVVIFTVGMAVDTGRAVQVANRTASALDSAALAAAKAMREDGLNDTEVAAVAADFFKANTQDSVFMGATYSALQVAIDQTAGSVSLSVTGTVPTRIVQIAGFNKFDINRSSTAIYNIRDIELGMMLDVTGSMRGQKIADLRAAAKDLVDVLITNNDSSQKVRIGLAPYSASVNAGTYADDVTDPSNPSVDGCVIERTGSEAYQDTMPGMGTWISSADPSAPPPDTDPTQGFGSYRCPTATIMPLTDDYDALKSRIDSFTAGGWTSGHIGLAWAWYLISPDWDNIWPGNSTPVAYQDGKTIKAVILMTDGSFNTAYANGPSFDQARNMCDEMRSADKGIIVYSIAFDAPADAEQLLKDCRTPENAQTGQTYFNASNGDELRAAFRSIAIQLNNLRISQ